MRLELPHEQWAELRDPDQIPRKAARSFRKVLYSVAVPAAEESGGVMSTEAGLLGLEDMAEALILAAVDTWSFGAVTPEVLETVPDGSVDAIYDECQRLDYIDRLTPDFGVKPAGDGPEDSPTTPS